MLDYDGTLAPFQVDRSKALPLAGVTEVLRRIQKQGATRLVIVSGRPVSEVLELTGLDGVMVVGGHGYETRDESGQWVRHALPQEDVHRLDALQDVACRAGYGERLERKAAGLALHTRGLPHSEAREVEKAVDALWKEQGAESRFEFRSFNGGLELRAHGRHKGMAVAELLAAAPPETLAVYLGDDETDEDAFRALKGQGVGFKVGPFDVPTAAEGRLIDCETVFEFLKMWEDRVSGAS
jgi:trehalose-phosphatase